TRAIEKSLETISDRENVGYITERMIQHRLRLLALSDELKAGNVNNANADAWEKANDDTDSKRLENQSIGQLLGALAEARTYQERQPIKRQLYASSTSTSRTSLASIKKGSDEKAEIKRLASLMLNTIQSRSAREDHAVVGANESLRVS